MGRTRELMLQREARRTRASIGDSNYLDRSERAVRREGGVTSAVGADGRIIGAIGQQQYGENDPNAGPMHKDEPGLKFNMTLDGEFVMDLYGQDAEEVSATYHGFDIRSLTEEANNVVREWLEVEQDEAGDACKYKTISDIPAIALDGHLFALHEVYQAAQTVGGCNKVQSWKLVSDLLLRNRADLTRQDEMSSGGQYVSSIPRTSTVSAAARVQRFFYERLLDRVEERLREGEDEEEGKEVESSGAWRDALSEGDQNRLVVQTNGRWVDAPTEGLVLAADEMFHHVDVPFHAHEVSGYLPPVLAKRFEMVDGSIENVKWWWDKYTLFNSNRASRQPDHWIVALVADRDVNLFSLYHEVMRHGGLYSVVTNDKWWHVMTQISVQWYHSAYADLLKCYARHLYAYEVWETKGIKIGDVSEHLFQVPLTAAKAGELSKGQASKAIRNAEAIGKVLKNLESGEGRAGLAGAVGNGARHVWERAGCGAGEPDLEWEREKRICRSLDSGERGELGWALGVLTTNCAEVSENEMAKVPVMLTEAVLAALCRFIARVIRDECEPSTGNLLLLSSYEDENRSKNITVALSVLRGYTHVHQIAEMVAKSQDVAMTLARCLEWESVDVRCGALNVISTIAPFFHLKKCNILDCINALLRPPTTAPPRLVAGCFRTLSNLAQLPDNGEELAASLDQVHITRALELIVRQHRSSDAAADCPEDAAMNLILALSRSNHSIRRRLAGTDQVIAALVSVVCGEIRSKPHRAAASRALKALTVLDCPAFTDSILAREDAIASACLSLSLGSGSEDIVSNLGHLLLHITSAREREKRLSKLASEPKKKDHAEEDDGAPGAADDADVMQE